ncbi:restriction endonuclease subunit S [Pseudomonas sp. GCM10022188]|uniref:restriction endonuclease subunit S n=1 Tax=Pseudomonas TaxID=286 RepID=UPI001E36038E
MARIGDLAELNPKQAFDDATVAGFVPMSHAPTNFRDKLRFDERPWGEIKKAYTNFKDGDVIFAKVTPCFENGKAAFVEGLPNGIGAGSSEFFVLRPSCDEVSAKYLLALVKSHDFLRKGAENMTGAVGLRRVPRPFVENYPVPVPPAAEQTRIAAKLDELLAQVDTLKARIDGIPALLKRFRQSVLAAAVSGRLTEEWRRERALPELSEVELGELIKEGPQNGLYKPSSAYGRGVKIIRIDGFYSGEITGWEGLRSLEVDQRELETWSVRNGDILINRVNSVEYLGKCALVRSVPEPAVFESNIMRMSLKSELVHPEYLMRFLSSEIGRKKLIAKAKHAVNQASINQGDVKACKVSLPSLEEQTEIVRRVEQLFAFADQLEAKVNEAKTRIDRLTQSILAKAFRGELVPQDPDDEPASGLLARIQAQRASAPKTRQRRKA